MKQLFAAIDGLQAAVFDYQTVNISEPFISTITKLEGVTGRVPEGGRPLYNQILEYMLQAFENRDYLLLADIAEYELKPFLTSATGGAD